MQIDKLPTNTIITGESVEVLSSFPSSCIDLAVFSPPYDSLRDYTGHYKINLNALGCQIYRVLKNGAVAVMVIQDETQDGWKTLTSFRTIVDWCDNIGFGLFECNIYSRNGKDGGWWAKRFRVDHEYMPIFIKGRRPKYFYKEGIKIPCKHAGVNASGSTNRNKDGSLESIGKTIIVNALKCPGTIWHTPNRTNDRTKFNHPATFSDGIPHRFIQVFTQKNDVVLDPFIGSGTTAIAAKLLERKYIGIDISEEYCDLTKTRLDNTHVNMTFDFGYE